ncbi:MAG: hypothetical protein XE08_0654 [Parcubacteria bacterium 32_520]|jgi:hypothetical protein|nr:MAG: hypothetical protein XE08_0654 [Parcubacteria bacterium 32_520]
MKKIGKIGVVAILGVAVVCLIVGYSAVDQGGILIPRDNTETKEEETVFNSAYTVEHRLVRPNVFYKFYSGLELTITGPPDDLLIIISDSEGESRCFIPREQFSSSGEIKVTLSFGTSGTPAESYNVTIKKSDIDKNEGKTVYKGRIDLRADLDQ